LGGGLKINQNFRLHPTRQTSEFEDLEAGDMDLKILQRLKDEIDRILPEIINIRHAIHQNPEIAVKEYKTAELIRKTLKTTDIRLLEPFLVTDVVGILEGRGKGKNVTLRADIDALPMQEITGLPYASQTEGLMHACGHDGHTAMLIGAALVLNRFSNEFSGSVRFVFQPGEEIVAAGKDLVAKGALQDPPPDAVAALHAWPDIGEGVIGSKPGVMMAAADFFKLIIKGRGAHGARPEISIDPVLTAARVVEGLQVVVSRNISVLDPAVLSVCRICGGTNSNVIPDTVELEGTTRYFKPELSQKIAADMERIIKGVCDSMGASYEFSYASPYIPTINHAAIVDVGRKIAAEVLGPEFWQELHNPSMGGEDFSYYIREYPGAMFRIGMGGESAALHNTRFDFNDNALKNGVLFLVAFALDVLSTN
jgi:amidohydrolase